ncbi:Abnormal spindle-like microcephaly-associated [Liparis tanakae]|uniref:Abnormal spindle-like microcephaly-associated n=1 Tax=Liparis tanakae TaxID=230148 RepID=A0A4Z2F6R3_9TELE|nr:Abnormal spindle-like microcephaly-associated [Liparis tanakae]
MPSSSLRTARSVAPAQAKQSSSKLSSRGARSSGISAVKTAKVVALAQSKLTFIKPLQTAIPRHPMPFAATNMFYDERWIEKQERGFTWWINYVLTPDDFKVNTEVAEVNAVSLAMGSGDKCSVARAPTKEEMSFSTYTARRKLNRLRRAACQLFTSEASVKAIQRLELEVEAKRLLIRKDRHLWKDIGERRKVLNWLLSYNPLWLRIGLEVFPIQVYFRLLFNILYLSQLSVSCLCACPACCAISPVLPRSQTIFGELISLESNSDALGLALFILQRLLWNPDIAAQFRHAKVPNLYKDGHEEALSRFTLKKLLLLVCFLDKAKESRLIEHNPCLFCLDAEFKTSKDLLLAFSRDFLSGEGILPRHLGYMGLPVSHVQKPLDEFNFAVKNLAVDLKCGIRLVRVMELLVQDWTLSATLRLPAISRLQKVHNVDVALQVLKSKGVDLEDEHGNSTFPYFLI